MAWMHELNGGSFINALIKIPDVQCLEFLGMSWIGLPVELDWKRTGSRTESEWGGKGEERRGEERRGEEWSGVEVERILTFWGQVEELVHLVRL